MQQSLATIPHSITDRHRLAKFTTTRDWKIIFSHYVQLTEFYIIKSLGRGWKIYGLPATRYGFLLAAWMASQIGMRKSIWFVTACQMHISRESFHKIDSWLFSVEAWLQITNDYEIHVFGLIEILVRCDMSFVMWGCYFTVFGRIYIFYLHLYLKKMMKFMFLLV